jgi:branched-chain amino acid aminotransferase
MPIVVDLNGQLVPPDQACLSVFDRGFLQGDSVYEVLRTYGGRPFEVEAHLRRLVRSADRSLLPLPWPPPRAAAEIARTVSASLGGDPPDGAAAPWNAGERSVRVVMTRGGGDTAPQVPASAIVIAEPLVAPPLVAYREGVALVTVTVERAEDPTVKTGARLAHALALRQARARGAHEALFADARGRITEGASSNLFAVRGGHLVTPPLEVGILEGVTRGVVLRVARAEGLPVEEAPLDRAELTDCDEIFITSTAREILPARELDGRTVGMGRPGPMTLRLHAAFRRLASTVPPT